MTPCRRRTVIHWCQAFLPLLLAAAAAAPAERLYGTWSAGADKLALSGTWTKEPDSDAGTWTLRDASGRDITSGTWAVRKAVKGGQGRWTAGSSGGRTISGNWTAASHLPVGRTFSDLLRSAVEEIVTGAWRAGRLSGDWAIRAVLDQ
jgi:hypothetical protein